MRSGEFKYPVKIYHPHEYIDDYGEQVKEYQLYTTTKASINWKSGTKTEQNFELFIPNTITLYLRHYTKITDDTRIEIQGKMYDVISYHNDLKYRDIEVTVKEVNV